MNVKFSSASGDRDPSEEAFTLIEVIGVLAVIAILAVIILPNLLHQLDVAASQQEVNTLQSFGNALQSSICRKFYIPGTNDWATNIATEVGTGTPQVATNSRGLARVFLIDPNIQIGTNATGTLPYTQNVNGSSNQPVNPRFLILSSIGKPLPANLFSGVSAGDFSNIWNTADGTPPTNATGFATWTTLNASDLKVQRINLSSLFVQLVLSTYSSTTNGRYMINPPTPAVTNSAPTNSGVSAFYLQNSVVRLINAPSTNVSSDQILIHNSSFVYYQNVWLSSISSGSNTNGASPSGDASIGLDFNTIVANFLAAPTNSQASSGASQTVVVNDMISYLNAYDAWASSASYPSANAQYTAALNAQSTLSTDLNNLINGL